MASSPELPDHFDVIVYGTGLPESIVAAAAARVGKSVLHLDRHEYYGNLWASFNFDNLNLWADNHQSPWQPPQESPAVALEEGERLEPLHAPHPFITNVEVFAAPRLEQVPEEPEVKPEEPEAKSEESAQPTVEVEDPAASLRKLSKKFNLDLTPKVLYSRGSMVNLLISSNTTRYAEFKAFTRVLTLQDGALELVPVTRADVFATKNISIIEKRMLMKFLTSCLDQKSDAEPVEDIPFGQFLESKNLSANLQHYIIYAIAMVERETPAPVALRSIQKFLSSLGYYGNSPFLWPIYGNGELSQGFCRLCAVFGGTYHLKRGVEHLVVGGEDGACRGVVSEGQRLTCQWLVVDPSYASEAMLDTPVHDLPRLSKAVLITDQSVLSSDKEEITLLRVPPGEDVPKPVTVIEVGPGTLVCPPGHFVVYLTAAATGDSAKEDLEPAIRKIFTTQHSRVLWSLYYNQVDASGLSQKVLQPGLALTPTPSASQDYEDVVERARALFVKMFPDEEFLPRAPDPDEIVLETMDEDANQRQNENNERQVENAAASGEPTPFQSGDKKEETEGEQAEAAEIKPNKSEDPQEPLDGKKEIDAKEEEVETAKDEKIKNDKNED